VEETEWGNEGVLLNISLIVLNVMYLLYHTSDPYWTVCVSVLGVSSRYERA
jgi:hypothetical protein